MSYKGKYTLKNPEKYIGDREKVIFRSLWERRCMVYFDTSPRVRKWASEEVVLKYISPIDGNWHRYFVDFWIEIVSKDGKTVNRYLIEVKPHKYSVPPKEPKRRTKKYYTECRNFLVNQAKWEVAKKVCEEKDWEFQVWTEKNVKFT